ncbi:MAG TPA: hypothetical protein VGG62_08650 [Terracidiphilus sp.]|jgi:hypothetical protein
MPQHDDEQLGSHGPKPEEIDTTAGYELSDVRVTGIVVFLTALAIFVAVTGILCYGIGKVINAQMKKEDGPNSKWTKTAEVRELGNMPSSPELQNKMAELTQQFPAPRVQTDDGNQDVADLHAREDLLLENYTRVEGKPGAVRIPIERAMELVAKQGLPVAPAVEKGTLLTGDKEPAVVEPLTNGFARTAYELDVEASRAAEAKRPQ